MAPYEKWLSYLGKVQAIQLCVYRLQLYVIGTCKINPSYCHKLKRAIVSLAPVMIKHIFLAYYFNYEESIAILDRNQFQVRTIRAAILVAEEQIRLYMQEQR